VLCLHDVVPERPESQWDVTEDEAGGVIERYRAKGYVIVTLDDLPSGADRALAVTVDDCLAGAVDWLLRRARVRTTVFVVPAWIDGPSAGFGRWGCSAAWSCGATARTWGSRASDARQAAASSDCASALVSDAAPSSGRSTVAATTNAAATRPALMPNARW
jgi:hypothetical protein